VKRYETGVMSKYLHDQRVGDTVLMSGPHQGGHWVDGMAKKVGFVAAGTGITPMISIIRWILTKRLDAELFLVFANKTEDDIIFRDEWERDVLANPNFHPSTQGATAVKPWRNAQRASSVALAKEDMLRRVSPKIQEGPRL
jgi:cytochrome-b5 reductase